MPSGAGYVQNAEHYRVYQAGSHGFRTALGFEDRHPAAGSGAGHAGSGQPPGPGGGPPDQGRPAGPDQRGCHGASHGGRSAL